MIREMCCIICPMSCHLQVEMNDKGTVLGVKGNRCPRGEAYARSEAVDPQRVVTTTIRIHHASLPLLPVITSRAISKSKVTSIMEMCRNLEIYAPVMMNDVIVENIADSGADLIASRSMDEAL